MLRSPLIILGFGRSGTTWLSDIISKYTGRLILFEPYHPCVYQDISDTIYRTAINAGPLKHHAVSVLSKGNRDKWLLRNHLPSHLEEIDDLYIDHIWSHSELLGLKSIRINTHFVPLVKDLNAQVIFIIRHPLAVIASIINRPRYWEDIGFDMHWKLLTRSIQDDRLAAISKKCQDRISQNAFIWSYTNMLAYDQLKTLRVLPLYYEDLYIQPYETATALLKKLDHYHHPIHPSHLFTPSLLGLSTIHSRRFSALQQGQGSLDFFWNETLNKEELHRIISIIEAVGDIHPAFGELCSARSYI